jgi:hypothetical protein
MNYPLGAFVRPAIGLFISLIFFELFLGTKLPNRLLPMPAPYYSEAVLLRDKTLDKFKMERGEPEVVVIGSSVAYTNVVVEKLGEELGKRAFGLGLPGIAPGSVEQFWRHHWSAKVPDAKTVLMVLRPRDIVSDYVPEEDAKLMGSRIERGWIKPAERSVLDESWWPKTRLADFYGSLSKAISAQRKPLLGVSFWNDDFGNQLQEGVIDLQTEARIVAEPRYKGSEADGLATRTNWVDMIEKIKSQVKGRFIVVYSPDFGKCWDEEKGGERWAAETMRVLRSRSIECVAPLANDHKFMNDRESYEDIAHFTKPAAMKFTLALIQDLKSMGL